MFDQAFLDAACRLEDFLFTSPNTGHWSLSPYFFLLILQISGIFEAA